MTMVRLVSAAAKSTHVVTCILHWSRSRTVSPPPHRLCAADAGAGVRRAPGSNFIAGAATPSAPMVLLNTSRVLETCTVPETVDTLEARCPLLLPAKHNSHGSSSLFAHMQHLRKGRVNLDSSLGHCPSC